MQQHSHHAIDLEHVRRGERVLSLLVERFGVAHFLERTAAAASRMRTPRLNRAACEDALALARTWIERRTGRAVHDDELRCLRRTLARILTRQVKDGVACLSSLPAPAGPEGKTSR